MRRVFPLVAVCVLLMVVFMFGASNQPIAALDPTVTPGVQVNPTAVPLTIDLASVPSPRVLAWNPNTTSLSWLASGGASVLVAKASSDKAIISACGMSPSGDRLIIYQGGTTAQAFVLPFAGGAVLPLGANTGLACAVHSYMQFSPDGNRLAFIKFDQTVGNNNYTLGTLRVLKLPQGIEEFSLPGVEAFDLQNDGLVAVQLFTNTKNQAKNADVIGWDGTKQRKVDENLPVLNKDDKADCEFITARLLRVGDKVFELYGEKCRVGGSTWRIRRADFAGGNGQEIVSGKTGVNGSAVYYYNAASNDMMLLPDGKTILFTVPNGVQSNLVNLARLSTTDGKVDNVIGNVVVNIYPPTQQSQFVPNPKKDMLALVTRNGDGAEQLYLYDLTKPATQPISVAGGGKLDRIPGVAWAGDGQHLFYNLTGDTQALFSYDLKGNSKIVARGTFIGLASSLDGKLVASNEQVKNAPSDIRNNLVAVSTDDGTRTNIIEGAKGDQPISIIAVR